MLSEKIEEIINKYGLLETIKRKVDETTIDIKIVNAKDLAKKIAEAIVVDEEKVEKSLEDYYAEDSQREEVPTNYDHVKELAKAISTAKGIIKIKEKES